MQYYPDPDLLIIFVMGLEMVLTLVKCDELRTKECRNNLSARSQTDVVSELIQKELYNGCNYGPFCKSTFEHYRVSPLGVTTGKYSHIRSLKKFIFRYQYLVEIYSVSAEKIISDAFSYSENV
jgi:hypothetical protein